MDAVTEMEQALGAEVVRTLVQRRLLWSAPVVAGGGADETARRDRTSGAVLGLAAGEAGGHGRVGAGTQTFVLSAEAWLDHGWHAPAALIEQLSRELTTLRVRGQAIGAAVEAHRAGVPWYLGASTSYGHDALARAVAVGAVFAGDPSSVAVRASADCVVTHADRRASAASAVLAALTAALIGRDPATAPVDVCRTVAAACPEAAVRERLELVLGALGDAALLRRRRWGVRAADTLALGLWCALSSGDGAGAVASASGLEHGSPTARAVAGAIAGAIHGAAALPAAWSTDVEGAPAFARLAARMATATAEPQPAGPGPAGSDIWFLLDRSGSMKSIARDVVAGFDRFFAEQRAAGGDATVTIVQFDGEDPHDVIVDAAQLPAVRSIAGRFEPRGMTPLYDAVGLLLDRAERRGGDDADQLVVVLTDGAENASHLWTQQRLFARIEELRERGWTFAFLGANQDSYATGGSVGIRAGNVSNFAPSPAGVDAAYDGLSRTVREWRGKSRAARREDRDEFWGGHKEAEER